MQQRQVPLTIVDLADFAEKHGMHFHVDAAWDRPSFFSKGPQEENGRHRQSRHVVTNTHGVGRPGTHDPEQCHFVTQTASYIIRKGSTVAGRFTQNMIFFARRQVLWFGGTRIDREPNSAILQTHG